MGRWIERHWQHDTALSRALLPLAGLYRGAVGLRRMLYRRGWRARVRLAVPVIVVGNVTVGGTGKTPLVLWIAGHLQAHGWRPGIVTRGYGGRARRWPQVVTAYSDPALVGDEPVLLARRGAVPVVADPDRPRGARWLLAHECDVVLSDDGLQHYRLARDLEIAVLDGERGLGNGRCLPAGPLREPAGRLDTVDALVVNGGDRGARWSMALAPLRLRRVADPEETAALDAFRGCTVHAVAGIGNPARFFALLRGLGMEAIEHAFADHHRFRARDLDFGDGRTVLMTEKDAVKCREFADAHAWYVEVEARIDEAFGEWLRQRLRATRHG